MSTENSDLRAIDFEIHEEVAYSIIRGNTAKILSKDDSLTFTCTRCKEPITDDQMMVTDLRKPENGWWHRYPRDCKALAAELQAEIPNS